MRPPANKLSHWLGRGLRLATRSASRRIVVGLLAWLVLPTVGLAQQIPTLTVAQAASALADGGYVLFMRHSRTISGFGDPPEFDLERCATQRNLSDTGRAHAKRIAAAFKDARIDLSEIRHSQWCRCRDTALPFGAATPLPALNSTFAGQGDPAAQLAQMHALAANQAAGTNVLWVTHQVIVSAAAGSWAAQGDILGTRFEHGRFNVVFRIPTDD